MTRAGRTCRLILDDLGGPRPVVDASTGSVAQKLCYDAFGRVTRDANPGFQPFGWAGGLYDPDTGLVRFGARDYDPETGRWTAKDPIGFAGGDTNLYGYLLNDPVNWTDSLGLWFGEDVASAIGGAASGGYNWLTDKAENAVEFYASLTTNPCSSRLERLGGWGGGFLASLATSENLPETALTLTGSTGVGRYLGRRFWQYYPRGNPGYRSRYLTRGRGRKPPYKPGDEAASKLSLPSRRAGNPNPGTGVRKVKVPWWKFVRGPKRVKPRYGHPGGGWEFWGRNPW